MCRFLFKFLTFLVLGIILLPIFTFAQTNSNYAGDGITENFETYEAQEYQPLAPIAGFNDENYSSSLVNYINMMFHLGIYIATGLAVVMIMVGGMIYITSDAVANKNEGKEYIASALWGLFLALFSWAILNTINPALLQPQNLEINLQNNQQALNNEQYRPNNTGTKPILRQESLLGRGTFINFRDGTNAWVSPPPDNVVNCYDSNWSWISYGPCL